MLLQMAGDFLFWWLLVLGIGVGVVLFIDRYLKRSRKRQAVDGPFAWLNGKVEKPPEPVEEPPAAAATSGAGRGQAQALFDAPLPEPRRYLIGKGPAEEDGRA